MFVRMSEEYRGNVKWNNDWACFLNGIFTFLIHKNMENNDCPADVTNIRQLYIDPSKFENCVGTGTETRYYSLSLCIIIIINGNTVPIKTRFVDYLFSTNEIIFVIYLNTVDSCFRYSDLL